MQRKNQHLDLTATSQIEEQLLDKRFFYEPLFSAHPISEMGSNFRLNFLNYTLKLPLWISSMTGGVERAKVINHNLAKVCQRFKIGMGLGSVRCLLDTDQRFDDFNLRPLMPDAPIFANLGIAQIEQIINQGELNKLDDLLQRLQVDGLIVHLNLLQEWFQKGGDRLKKPAIESLNYLVSRLKTQFIFKEVGHGLGPRSLSALVDLKPVAIELAAFGGTNFTAIERKSAAAKYPTAFEQIGVEKQSMLEILADRFVSNQDFPLIIISGGIRSLVDAHYYQQKFPFTSIVAMAGAILPYTITEEDLDEFIQKQVDEYLLAQAFLTIRS